MDYQEREELKRQSSELLHGNEDNPEIVMKATEMRIRAHWFRETEVHPDLPAYDVYAGHWLFAQRNRVDAEADCLYLPTDAYKRLVAKYPPPEKPRIADERSSWNSRPQ